MTQYWKLSITADAKAQIRGMSEEQWAPLADALVTLLQSPNPKTAIPSLVKPLKASEGFWWILKIREPQQVRVIFRLTNNGLTLHIGDSIPTEGVKHLEILFAGVRCSDFYSQVKKLFMEVVDA